MMGGKKREPREDNSASTNSSRTPMQQYADREPEEERKERIETNYHSSDEPSITPPTEGREEFLKQKAKYAIPEYPKSDAFTAIRSPGTETLSEVTTLPDAEVASSSTLLSTFKGTWKSLKLEGLKSHVNTSSTSDEGCKSNLTVQTFDEDISVKSIPESQKNVQNLAEPSKKNVGSPGTLTNISSLPEGESSWISVDKVTTSDCNEQQEFSLPKASLVQVSYKNTELSTTTLEEGGKKITKEVSIDESASGYQPGFVDVAGLPTTSILPDVISASTNPARAPTCIQVQAEPRSTIVRSTNQGVVEEVVNDSQSTEKSCCSIFCDFLKNMYDGRIACICFVTLIAVIFIPLIIESYASKDKGLSQTNYKQMIRFEIGNK